MNSICFWDIRAGVITAQLFLFPWRLAYMKPLFATLVLALIVLGACQAQAKATSEYTSLDDCKTLASSENDPNAEIDYFSAVCKGRDGYRVMYAGGDARSWIDLVPKTEKIPDTIEFGISVDGRQGYFPNIAGRKLEWRYNDGKLTALIVRTSGMDPESDQSRDHLTVIRINTNDVRKSCVIAVVNARNSKANEKARIAADSARQCAN